jgi:methionyl-tRNA formyltransferase
MKFGYFSSGNLGYECLIHLDKMPELIFTDRKSTEIQRFAESHEIPIFVGKPDKKLAKEFLNDFEIDIILSVNYIFLLTKEIFNYPKNGSINLHGSLLPKYRGRTPHVWAIINGESITGVTAHFIDDGCDTGDIILQCKVPILDTDTGQDILEKFKSVYPILIRDILVKLESGDVNREIQDYSNSSSYGKRIPEDGLINWNNESINIYNWVRAQSTPYPGAFSYYSGNKVIIDWVITSNYHGTEIPGTILSTVPLMVKTGDGAIIIKKIRNNTMTKFKTNSIFQNE